MDDDTQAPDAGDRRGGDRRIAADPGYAGPERRVAQRRAGNDRRRSPRLSARD